MAIAGAALVVAVISAVITYQAWKHPVPGSEMGSAEAGPQWTPSGPSETELNEEGTPESPPQTPPVDSGNTPSGSGAAVASTSDIGGQVTTAESTSNPEPAGPGEGATVIARTDGQGVEAAPEPPGVRSRRRLGEIFGAPPLSSTEDPPVVPSTEPAEGEEPQAQPLDPQVTSGEVISVVTKPFVEPKGPRPLREPRLPPVPRKDMKSGLIGGVMVCQVAVSAVGQPGVECGRTGGPSGFDEYLRREAKQMLEALPWTPATNTEGEPCAGIVEVRFMWQ